MQKVGFLGQFRGLFKEKDSKYVSIARVSYWITYIIACVFWMRILISGKNIVVAESLVSVLTALLIYNIGKKLVSGNNEAVSNDEKVGFFKQFRSLFKEKNSSYISLGRVSFWMTFALISSFWIKSFVTLDVNVLVPSSLTSFFIICLIYNMGKKFTPFIFSMIKTHSPKDVVSAVEADMKGAK